MVWKNIGTRKLQVQKKLVWGKTAITMLFFLWLSPAIIAIENKTIFMQEKSTLVL